MAEDIDDVFEDIQQDILDDLKGMKGLLITQYSELKLIIR